MKCEKCNIEVYNSGSNCPLCGRHLVGIHDESRSPYPDIDNLASEVTGRTVRILTFLTIIISISLLTVNLLTPYENLWSVIPISGVWVIWLAVGLPIIKKRITPFMIILDDVIVCIFLNIVDITLGQSGWAMSYVVPFILSGSALIITVIVTVAKISWREFYMFQTAIVAICILPIILRAFIDFVFWPSLVSAIYGLITLLGMVILGNKKFKYEMIKRFHI